MMGRKTIQISSLRLIQILLGTNNQAVQCPLLLYPMLILKIKKCTTQAVGGARLTNIKRSSDTFLEITKLQ